MRLTVQAGIVGLTRRKQGILDREYFSLQQFLHGDKTVLLYSANKQQALRYYKKVKQKEYLLSLRRDLINLRRAKAFWFLKIPVYGVRGESRFQLNRIGNFPTESSVRAELLGGKADTLLCSLSSLMLHLCAYAPPYSPWIWRTLCCHCGALAEGRDESPVPRQGN